MSSWQNLLEWWETWNYISLQKQVGCSHSGYHAWLQTSWRDCGYVRYGRLFAWGNPIGSCPIHLTTTVHALTTLWILNICEGVVTNALQSCSKEPSCNQMRMLWGFSVYRGCKMSCSLGHGMPYANTLQYQIKCIIQTDQARLGLVALHFNNHYVWEFAVTVLVTVYQHKYHLVT